MRELNLKIVFQDDDGVIKFLSNLDLFKNECSLVYEIAKNRKSRNGKHSATPKKTE